MVHITGLSEIVPPLWFDEIGTSHRETVFCGIFQVVLNLPVVELSIRRAFEHTRIGLRLVEIFKREFASTILRQRRRDVVSFVEVQLNDSSRQNDHVDLAPANTVSKVRNGPTGASVQHFVTWHLSAQH